MRDYRKFCRPKTTKSLELGDHIVDLNCGNSVFFMFRDFNRIMNFFKHYSTFESPTPGMLRVYIPEHDIEINISPSNYKQDYELLEIIGQKKENHNYVEIGGVKWATMNLGAESITDYGLYYQWGDIQGYTAEETGSGSGQKAFTWNDYKFNPSGDGSTFTKYNATDGKTVLDSEDDAVTAAWGGNWRIPTTEEFQALGTAINTVWTEDYQGSGIAGLILTDKTDSSKVLFFPAAGNCDSGSRYGVGSDGMFWSSSRDSSVDVDCGYSLNFVVSAGVDWGTGSSRSLGFSVRGVFTGTQDYDEGDIIAHNDNLDQDVVFSYEDWLQLDSSWTFKGIVGVDTYTEKRAENGYYIIQDSNGFKTIIKPDDLTKVQDNWEFVEIHQNS